MPVVAINIESGLYEAVERALARGNYSDLQQFFVVAVRNQLALEASVALEQPVAPAGASTAPSATHRTARPRRRLDTSELPAMLKAVPAAAAPHSPSPRLSTMSPPSCGARSTASSRLPSACGCWLT